MKQFLGEIESPTFSKTRFSVWSLTKNTTFISVHEGIWSRYSEIKKWAKIYLSKSKQNTPKNAGFKGNFMTRLLRMLHWIFIIITVLKCKKMELKQRNFKQKLLTRCFSGLKRVKLLWKNHSKMVSLCLSIVLIDFKSNLTK